MRDRTFFLEILQLMEPKSLIVTDARVFFFFNISREESNFTLNSFNNDMHNAQHSVCVCVCTSIRLLMITANQMSSPQKYCFVILDTFKI